jgi:hypothetical protein
VITHKHVGGDIVGFGEIDDYSTTSIDTWHIVQRPCELIWMDKEDLK